MLQPWQILIDPWLLRQRHSLQGMALWPFVLVRGQTLHAGTTPLTWVEKNGVKHLFEARLLNHEQIHLRQQAEMLLVPFYLWYGIEYGIRRLKHPHDTAYSRISFEQEAYAHDTNQDYLQHRKPYAWLRYLL
jgi:hypothetical protein